MSMLSAQCDELRAMAESIGLAMPQAATLMMEAADTIWELRNRCSDLVNKREWMFRANVEKNRDLMRLMDENAKLRKLASELYQQVLQDDAAWHDVRAWEDGLPSDCLHPIRSYDDSLGKHTVAPKFEQRMRELGVEL